eukprot:3994205-Prymnesium_polylepis.2
MVKAVSTSCSALCSRECRYSLGASPPSTIPSCSSAASASGEVAASLNIVSCPVSFDGCCGGGGNGGGGDGGVCGCGGGGSCCGETSFGEASVEESSSDAGA